MDIIDDLALNKDELTQILKLIRYDLTFGKTSDKIYYTLVKYFKKELDKNDFIQLTKYPQSIENKNHAFSILRKTYKKNLTKEDWIELSRHGGTLYIRQESYQELINYYK